MLPRPKYPQAASRHAVLSPGDRRDARAARRGARRYISFTPLTMRGGMWEVLTTDARSDQPGRIRGAARRDTRRIRDSSRRASSRRWAFRCCRAATSARPTRWTRCRSRSSANRLRESIFRDRIRSAASSRFAWRRPHHRRRGRRHPVARPRARQRAAGLPGGGSSATPLVGFYSPQDLIIRTSVPPATLMPAVRAIITKADPQLPITDMRTLDEVVIARYRAARRAAARAGRVCGDRVPACRDRHPRPAGLHGLGTLARDRRPHRAWRQGQRHHVDGDGPQHDAGVHRRPVGAVLAYAAGRSMQALLFGVDPADAAVFSAAIGCRC